MYLGKDCKCGHYRTNHKTVNGNRWVGQCKGQTGCAGHEPCKCKSFVLAKQEGKRTIDNILDESLPDESCFVSDFDTALEYERKQ